ncbi:magnesium transporter NIPA protein [Medicago truncatula]|uniref:Magnesium transporter NIPA protein n=1 Tax=Medicago truncatula TaxID=3880 RepID=A0A072U934_MEDTR|nr:magnesium transporter NIPA protein [Medicago truncatula]
MPPVFLRLSVFFFCYWVFCFGCCAASARHAVFCLCWAGVACVVWVLGGVFTGGYVHRVSDLTFGVDLKQIRLMGILQRENIVNSGSYMLYAETCYPPLVQYVTYNRLGPIRTMGCPSYYVPPLPCMCTGFDRDPYQFQSTPLIPFGFFGDENASGCSVMWCLTPSNTVIVSPIYYVMFTTLAIIATVIMFKDFERSHSFRGGGLPSSPTLSVRFYTGNEDSLLKEDEENKSPEDMCSRRQDLC